MDHEHMDGNPVDARNAKLHFLYNRYIETNDKIDAMELMHEIQFRVEVEARFDRIKARATGVTFTENPVLGDFSCYKKLIATYESECPADREYDLKFYKHFISLCNSDIKLEDKVALVSYACQ